MKKYKLLDRAENGLYRIQALQDIPEIGINAGDIGGYVENEENLSHEGSCWIFDDAEVRDQGQVVDDAQVCNRAQVSGCAIITNYSRISGYAHILDCAHIQGKAHVFGKAQIGDCVEVNDHAEVFGNADIGGYMRVCDDAQIYGDIRIASMAQIGRGARVALPNDILVVQRIGSRLATTTFYRTEEGISTTCGCFTGTIEEFKERVWKVHGDNKFAREYELACQLAELHILGGVQHV